jgi:hypothetical protein
VYFHNHGDPGPGIYLPSGWRMNRASWHAGGIPIPDEAWAQTLEPLPAEGFYRVLETFLCCEKRCQTFQAEELVQLGYNGRGEAILFVPQLMATGISLPESGTGVDRARLAKLATVKVAESRAAPPRDPLLH